MSPSALRAHESVLPAWQRSHADLVWAHMEAVLRRESSFPELSVSATRPGRRLRASLALQLGSWTRPGWCIHEDPGVLDGLAAVEFLHSASCILDDIIDGDTIRRGCPAFHVRTGLAQAILVSLDLVAISTGVLPHHVDGVLSSRRVAEMIQKTVRGEAIDSFPRGDLVHIRGIDAPLAGYLLKTSPGFALAHEVVGKALGEPAHATSFRECGVALGEYYQLCNDFYDWFEIPAGSRGASTDTVLVTVCAPLILAGQCGCVAYEAVGSHVRRDRLPELVEVTRRSRVDVALRDEIQRVRQRILGSLPAGAPSGEVVALLELIDSVTFWSYAYRI